MWLVRRVTVTFPTLGGRTRKPFPRSSDPGAHPSSPRVVHVQQLSATPSYHRAIPYHKSNVRRSSNVIRSISVMPSSNTVIPHLISRVVPSTSLCGVVSYGRHNVVPIHVILCHVVMSYYATWSCYTMPRGHVTLCHVVLL